MAFFDFLTGGGKKGSQGAIAGLGAGASAGNQANVLRHSANGTGMLTGPQDQVTGEVADAARNVMQNQYGAPQMQAAQAGGFTPMVGGAGAQVAGPATVQANDVNAATMRAANINQAQSNPYLVQNQQATNMLAGAAAGTAPSVAAIQQQQGLEAAQRQALSLGASAKGSADARAAAIHQGQLAGAQMGQAAINDAAALRAQEMATARGQFSQATQGMQGQLAEQAATQAGLVQQARLANQGVNMQAQLANQGAGLQAQLANQQAGMQTNQFNAGMNMQGRLANQGVLAQQQALNAQLQQQANLQNASLQAGTNQLNLQGQQIGLGALAGQDTLGLQAQEAQNQFGQNLGQQRLTLLQLQEKQANDQALAAQSKAGTTMQGIGGLLQGGAAIGKAL